MPRERIHWSDSGEKLPEDGLGSYRRVPSLIRVLLLTATLLPFIGNVRRKGETVEDKSEQWLGSTLTSDIHSGTFMVRIVH